MILIFSMGEQKLMLLQMYPQATKEWIIQNSRDGCKRECNREGKRRKREKKRKFSLEDPLASTHGRQTRLAIKPVH